MTRATRFPRPLFPMLAMALLTVSAAQAQVVGYNFRTGDAWVDTRLVEINDYGHRYREPFIDEMTGYYGAPRSLVVDLFGRNWSAGDIYYACAIAHILGIPCLNVVREYDRNPGQGWGNIAKRMGIKPGSSQFHALKNGFARTYDHWGYPVVVDRDVHVDWSKHGPGKGKSSASTSSHSGKGQGASSSSAGGQGKGSDKGKSKGSDKAKGNSGGNGNGGGKGNGNGNGNGKK